jgi:hypothetical protein
MAGFRPISGLFLPAALGALGGLLVSAVAVLWMRHGIDVYIARLADFAMTCF